jgi:predicted nucleic acid-binding Zn ribbon protein
MCNKEFESRKGKLVCSTTCRVDKKRAFDYFDAVLKQLKSITDFETEKCLEGIKNDERKRKRAIRIFDAWVEKRKLK